MDNLAGEAVKDHEHALSHQGTRVRPDIDVEDALIGRGRVRAQNGRGLPTDLAIRHSVDAKHLVPEAIRDSRASCGDGLGLGEGHTGWPGEQVASGNRDGEPDEEDERSQVDSQPPDRLSPRRAGCP